MIRSGHNLNIELKGLFERLGMGCKRKRAIKDDIQRSAQSNWKLYYQGNGEPLGRRKFRRKVRGLGHV